MTRAVTLPAADAGACYTRRVQAPATTDVLVVRLRALGIEVDASTVTRALYAHDASNYRITPLAVAFPRDAEEVSAIVTACAASGVPVTVRGAGTGMAGNTVGHGLVLDLRRHMYSVLEVDPEAGTARVQPGVVLDDLQAAVRASGRMFGPDPSSHSRATIGGMIGNDACGNHSVAYGRTGDHVIELELVLADGTRAVATRTGLRAVEASDAPRVQRIEQALRDTVARHGQALSREFDRCPRQVSGYAAHRLVQGFDIARLLVGSEGSLAVVVSATVALVPVPRETQLLVIGYASLVEAARDVPLLLEHRPAAIEAIDTAIVQTMRARRGPASVPELPEGEAWLYVEFADTVATVDLEAVASAVLVAGRARSAIAVDEPAQRAALWRVREDGAGLASSLLDGTRGRPGWEDAAVPPDRLAEYLEGLQTLQREHGFRGVLYGHFGAGCVHIRFDFDTASPAGRAAMRAFIRDAATLVARCGGSVSGEHGDGRARGELLSLMYSPAALAAFAEIKRAFDPDDLLNPGVIVDAPRLDVDMPDVRPSWPTTLSLEADGRDLASAAGRCVGVGRCVAAGLSAMCPTHGVSGLEADSTRGRARAIQDLFTDDGLTTGEVLETLDGCLSCKACAVDCPTGVDIATYKSEVLHRHYRGRLRPRSHYLLGWLPLLAGLATPVARALNPLLANAHGRRLVAAVLGVSSERRFPRFATSKDAAALRRLPRSSAPEAVLFVDALTRAFAPEVAAAAARVLTGAGVRLHTVAEGDSALTWISTGQLDAARRVQRSLLERFDRVPAEVPIIVLEPSAAATLAHDLPRLLDEPRAHAVAQRIRTFTQGLDAVLPGYTLPAAFPTSVVLQPHCHERATFRSASQAQWLRSRGVQVQEAVGCCGMGGNFGFERGHESMSRAVAERSLLPAIDAAGPASMVLADGFGCRCQVDDLRPGQRTAHLAEVIDGAR